jgi:hypothetical protein
VLSEFCAPIFDPNGNVVGIIGESNLLVRFPLSLFLTLRIHRSDAESWQKAHFTPERLLEVLQVCYDLGQHPAFLA